MQALTDFTRDYGVYSSGSSQPAITFPTVTPPDNLTYSDDYGMVNHLNRKPKADV